MPRAMRVQAGHLPQLSISSSPALAGPKAGDVQFSAWATASATRRFPTPSGPPNITLGGSDPPAIERDSSAAMCPWPTMSRKLMILGRIVSRATEVVRLRGDVKRLEIELNLHEVH